MIPLPVLLATAVGGWALLKEHTFSKAMPLPVPPPTPDGSPPAGASQLPGVQLQISLANAANIGDMVNVLWTLADGTGGGSSMPLAWVSADRSQAAVRWNITSGTSSFGASFGNVYLGSATNAPLF